MMVVPEGHRRFDAAAALFCSKFQEFTVVLRIVLLNQLFSRSPSAPSTHSLAPS
jgi:hypothetical protein